MLRNTWRSEVTEKNYGQKRGHLVICSECIAWKYNVFFCLWVDHNQVSVLSNLFIIWIYSQKTFLLHSLEKGCIWVEFLIQLDNRRNKNHCLLQMGSLLWSIPLALGNCLIIILCFDSNNYIPFLAGKISLRSKLIFFSFAIRTAAELLPSLEGHLQIPAVISLGYWELSY